MDDVSRAVQALVARGVLTDAQGEAVLDEVREHRSAPVSRWTEVGVFLGAALTLAAGVAIAAEFWSQLAQWARLAVLALAAAALFVAGRWVARGSPGAVGLSGAVRLPGATSRIVGVLWLLSTAATAAAAWTAADGWLPYGPEGEVFALGLATAVHGGLLWRVRRGALQQIGWYAGILLSLISGLELLERPPSELYGLAAWSVGVAWALLTWGGIVVPTRTGYALGASTALVGAQALVFAYPTAGLALAIATVGALFAAAASTRETVLVALASAALPALVVQGVEHWFPGTLAAPVVLFLVGVSILAGAVATIGSARRQTEGEAP